MLLYEVDKGAKMIAFGLYARAHNVLPCIGAEQLGPLGRKLLLDALHITQEAFEFLSATQDGAAYVAS